MFETLVSKPVFNLLTFIYAYLPGHNFGLAIILFTIAIRLLMWPLVKKQLHSSKAMRELQPELRRIKKETKGDRAKESELTMQLYKERGINPFSSLGTAVLQLPILLALFSGIKKIIANPKAIVTYSYGFIQHSSWMMVLAGNIDKLDKTLFGFIDLTQKPLVGSIFHLSSARFYWPGVIIALASAVVQYYSSKMLMVTDNQARGLRKILKDASSGTEADQAEVNAATMRMMRYLIPFMILITTINFACALGLYWFVSGLIQYLQQLYILGGDKQELGVATASIAGEPVIAEVIPARKPKPTASSSASKKSGKKKRRR
jgi:YidC/Oxa1 family membrane protein insertase